MPILWSPNMKDQHQASAQDLEKRLKFLDEYNEETGETNGTEEEKDSETPQDVSPSTQFFLTK
jgi:hypothetical protein